jgi:PilZ domain
MRKPHIDRAERMRVALPIRYRMAGHEHWLDSRILDISDSGVLFGPAVISPEPGTSVEMMFSSPMSIGSLAPGQMTCVGAIVRRNENGQVGARFSHCRFVLDDLPASPTFKSARRPSLDAQ